MSDRLRYGIYATGTASHCRLNYLNNLVSNINLAMHGIYCKIILICLALGAVEIYLIQDSGTITIIVWAELDELVLSALVRRPLCVVLCADCAPACSAPAGGWFVIGYARYSRLPIEGTY